MLQLKFLKFLWILVIFLVQQVTASLFPTKPVTDTTYTAGQPAEVTWIEDGRKPPLNATIGFKIDLYAGNETYIATLSKDSNPNSLYTTVYIPLSVPANYHYFNLRFIISQPPQIIYTADFNILPNPYLIDSSAARGASTQPPSVTTVTSTVISRITGTQSALPSITLKASRGVPRHWTLGGRRPVTIGRVGKVDVAKMKFRLVFMVWPALVGCSMAF